MDETLLPPEAEALIRLWPKRASMHGERGTCIEATKVCVTVLRKLGLDARPMPCSVRAVNREAFDLIEAGIVDVDEWPDTAWAVGVHLGRQGGDRTPSDTEPFRRSGGWDGHLVVEVDGWFFDLTAMQLSRPQYGITIDSCLWGPFSADDVGGEINLGASVVQYFWEPRVRSYRNTPAWRQDIPPALVDSLVSRILLHLNPNVTLDEVG